MQIKHIAFDCFGVLIDIDGHFFDSVCDQLCVERSDYMPIFSAYDNLFQCGHIDEKLIWEKVFGACSEDSLWTRAYTKLARPNREMIKLFNQVRAQYSVGILSNIESPLIPMIENALGLADDIFRFFSCEKGLRKPDIATYVHYAKQIGRPPSEIFFIDDNDQNVLSAREAGFHAILHKDLESTRSLIELLEPRNE